MIQNLLAFLIASNFSSVNESDREMTGRTLTRAESLLITRISVGDMVISFESSSSSSDSSSEEVSETRSGGERLETVVSDRVFVGMVENARRDSTVIMDEGSIM